MKILVSGGLGFIGSHTVIELIKNKYTVIIADNLSNSSIDVLDKIHQLTGIKPHFYQIDVTDYQETKKIFQEHTIDGLIHFAGFKAVFESIKKPLAYYQNNLLSTITLSRLCTEYHCNNFVFSSSATVYGDQESPLKEDMNLMPSTNPYGETKKISEKILRDTAFAHPEFSATLLRYFNPVGAHESGLIGEKPNGIPNNLMPYISKVAKGELKELSIFGNDYDTIDGTGVRDFIHVMDLAKAHVHALEKMPSGVSIYNLGTGKGISVLEMVNAFMKYNKVEIPYQFKARRAGDLATCYANVDKAKKELDWQALKSLEDMVVDSWRFEQMN